MPTAGIKVLLIGVKFDLPPGYEVVHLPGITNLLGTIATFNPDVLVTQQFIPGALSMSSFEIRKKWLNVGSDATAEAVANAIENCYRCNAYKEHQNQHLNPLISVYTPTHNTGDFIRDTYQSLRDQSYKNWEWVVVDDGSTDDTWERVLAISMEDIRVRPFKMKSSGKIGDLKGIATRLCNGVYYVELDHDDMLTEDALAEVKNAFESDQSIGMVYSNCSSIFQNGEFHKFPYPEWQSRYRWTEYHGKKWLECINPDIYDRYGPHFTQQFGWYLTVGPNHLRAYRAQTFKEFGGYNHTFPVADDWDLIARFFLKSKCFHIDKMLYIYRFLDSWSNTTFTRNKSIQDHMEIARNNYAAEFEAFNVNRLGQSKPTTADISYVILDATNAPLTVKCLESIRKHSPGSEIILIGNGVQLRDETTKLADRYIYSEINLKFAAGCNRGAINASRRLICFMNNDASFMNDTPFKLVNAFSPASIIGTYSSRAKPPQGDYTLDRIPAHDTNVDMVVGLCMLMPIEVFRRVGGFDPRFLTWEDDDFCQRARALGCNCKIVGSTYVEHVGHQTFNSLGLDHVKVEVENEKLYNLKHQKIRIVAIAKDEENCIKEFFEQFRSITSDFAMLDTGSTDKTIEVAKSIGVTVKSSPFVDFAHARNLAIESLGQGADWIIMLDPDERLDPHAIEHIPELARNARSCIYLAPLQARYPDGSTKQFIPKPFMFRPIPEIKWVFKVHEKLIGSQWQAVVQNALITHVIALHANKKREGAEGLYARLMSEEPYFQDPAYKTRMREEWPILDYDKMDDNRLVKTSIGPLISVVTPTYKRADLLRSAIWSADKQDYANLEIIVIGDNCPVINEGIPPARNVRVINLPTNHGAGGAAPRNYGIALAAGRWIAYLDDDNEWLPNHVSSVYEAIRTSPVANVTFGFSSMSVEGKDLEFRRPEKGGIDTSCVIHHKDLVTKYGWWKDRSETYAHDWELFNRWVSGNEKWVCTGKPTLLYNMKTSGQKEFLIPKIAVPISPTKSKLSRTEDRRDYPNICEHLPVLAKEAHGTVLDLGSREGTATGAFLAGVEAAGGTVWSVDIDAQYANAWADHPQWHFINADSLDKQKAFSAGMPQEIDVLFIDTDHTYDRTLNELKTWAPHVKPGGIIILHDTESFPDVKRALMDFVNTNKYPYSLCHNCNGLGTISIPDQDTLSACLATDEPCFIIASRTAADAARIKAQLARHDVRVQLGAPNIFAAYEQGRLQCTSNRRRVYIHDDCEILDVDGFISEIKSLPTGTHGFCGSANKDALGKGPWWVYPPRWGKVLQGLGGQNTKPRGGGVPTLLDFSDTKERHEVEWLDGLCLITVNQEWDWSAHTDKGVWHGYDWYACSQTKKNGDKCYTIRQPDSPFLIHQGLNRMEGYEEALKAVRGY